ncbi:hypothetical protein DQ384_26260 [Sphaerisporangium album]|uniref:Uncharacterized protein n=1 Tax=Sphaerisporangium album TaxID=509200 RepID=A0A367FC10_9ACTN|nr:hypothetical protein [Sphaerisporangium album]RCG27225.1 hypothetical protein DQ384_26260 [Sphaerisporangium album]
MIHLQYLADDQDITSAVLRYLHQDKDMAALILLLILTVVCVVVATAAGKRDSARRRRRPPRKRSKPTAAVDPSMPGPGHPESLDRPLTRREQAVLDAIAEQLHAMDRRRA